MLDDDTGSLVLRTRAPQEEVVVAFSGRDRPFGPDDVVLDLVVRLEAAHLSAETLVRTLEGSGLPEFLAGLAADFAGWDGARTWRSLDGDLTVSATFGSGGHVTLTWGLHHADVLGGRWRAAADTTVEAGAEMVALADAVALFLSPGRP
nr:DUF6228 family protein [Cellulomonas septica]